MKKFIAYFDYLGFKQFIENNDLSYQKSTVNMIFRDIESALSGGKTKDAPQGRTFDIAKSNINCINFSDTVVYWTNDDSKDSLRSILEVSYRFNWQAIIFCFPVRGSLVYGEIEHRDYKSESDVGGLYNINSVYGKGLVKAHEKAEKQHWAGTVIDESFINKLTKKGYSVDKYLEPFAKKYKVPYKNGITLPEQFVMRIVEGNLDNMSFNNQKKNIIDNFSKHNKSANSQDVQEKINNTINYLSSFVKV